MYVMMDCTSGKYKYYSATKFVPNSRIQIATYTLIQLREKDVFILAMVYNSDLKSNFR